MTKNVAWGVGAWSLAGLLLAGTAHAVPAEVGGFGAAGFGGPAGAGGFGGMVPPSELRALNIGTGVPVGGAILLTAAGSPSAPIVEVADEETPNTTLGGTIRQFEDSQYWIWVPSQPFIEGETYRIRLSAPDVGVFGVVESFRAVPAIPLSQPRLVSEPSASSILETHNIACCRQFFGGGVLEEAGCFASEQRRSIMLNPGLSTPDPAVLLGQFLFRVKSGAEAPAVTAPRPAQWPTAVPVMFYEQADEYCFDVEAIELVSGTVHAYADLARCAPHGQLPDLGVVAIEPGVAELDRAVCQAPPLAFEEPWCELNREPCADDADAPGCGLYGYVCRDEALPPDPFAAPSGFAGFQAVVGGASGSVESGGSGGTGAEAGGAGWLAGSGARSASSSMPEGDSDDGCSIAAPATRGHEAGAPAWFAGAAALLFAARRRARALCTARK